MTAEPRYNTLSEAIEDNTLVSLRGSLELIWRRLWLIALVSAMLTGVAVGFSFLRTPEYEASIKILVGQEEGITEAPADVAGLQQLTLTMSEAVNSHSLAETVIRRLDLRVSPEVFLKKMSAEQIPETQFILVSYRDTDPQRAQRVANAIGDGFSKQVSEVSTSANAITATVWEPAVVPDEPVSSNPLRNGLLALVLGMMLGVGLAFLLEYLDDSWHSAEEAEQISGLPTLGIIPEHEIPKSQRRTR